MFILSRPPLRPSFAAGVPRLSSRLVVTCVALLAALAMGCSGDLQDTRDDGQSGGTATEKLKKTTLTGGVVQLEIDASAADAWTFVHIGAGGSVHGKLVEVTDATKTAGNGSGWDLAFQRFNIAANGGISGSAGHTVNFVDSAKFDDVTEAPADGWVADQADSDDEGTDPDLGFLVSDGWYLYDAVKHSLAPRARVYFVKTEAGEVFKIAIEGYYNSVGTSGHIKLRVAPTTLTKKTTETTEDFGIPAAAKGEWTHVVLGSNVVAVQVADALKSDAWDLAASGVQLRTNGGTSGPGVGAAMAVTATFAELKTADTVGFSSDSLIPLPGPPGSGESSGSAALSKWYDYNAQTHAVSPRPTQAYVIRRAAGDYAKLQITKYEGGSLTVRVEALASHASVHERKLILAATEWTYLNLRRGVVVQVTDALKNLDWDVAVSGVQIRTNSGTSGSGAGGAMGLSDKSLADVSALPTKGIDVDKPLPLPGPPGSGKASGSEALSGWYNYDATTHQVSPKQAVFAVRCADGSLAAAAVSAYGSGTMAIAWRYAGPGKLTLQ